MQGEPQLYTVTRPRGVEQQKLFPYGLLAIQQYFPAPIPQWRDQHLATLPERPLNFHSGIS